MVIVFVTTSALASFEGTKGTELKSKLMMHTHPMAVRLFTIDLSFLSSQSLNVKGPRCYRFHFFILVFCFSCDDFDFFYEFFTSFI